MTFQGSAATTALPQFTHCVLENWPLSMHQRLANNPRLMVPPSLQESIPILKSWKAASFETIRKIKGNSEPPSSLLWILGLQAEPWLDLPGWLCVLPWPSANAVMLKPALILNDREMPSAGQIHGLALPWSREISVISPLPSISTVFVGPVTEFWIGAALDNSLFVLINNMEGEAHCD